MENQKRLKLLKWLYGRLPFFLCLLLIGVIGLLGSRIRDAKEELAAAKNAVAQKERMPVNVVVQEIHPRQLHDRISLPGVVAPWTELDMTAEVSGTILDVPVQEGNHVNSGDPLVSIDSRDYENRLHVVRAAHELAVLTKQRQEKLLAQKIISQAEFDDARARVASLAAEMEIAALQLERCTITAPISGVVNTLHAKKGMFLGIGDPVARILTIDRVKVVVGIPESDIDAVRKINRFDFVVDALDKKEMHGVKHFLAVAPDSMAQLYRLELDVDNRTGLLLPGMFARVNVVKQVFPEAISVPLYAVISRQDRRFVYVNEEGLAAARDVELGIMEGWQVQITKGLQPEDQVVVVGHRNTEAGQRINVVRTVTSATEIIR